MEFKRISNIDLLYKKNTDAKKAVVMLHGYGASMQDLAPLYDYLDPNSKFDWYFLDGNISIDIGYGMTGKAWFHIDMYKLQMALSSGNFSDFFEQKRPQGLDEASSLVTNFLKQIYSNYTEGIILGGFSQGSMLSLDITLKNPNLINKIFLLSSTLFDEANLLERLNLIKEVPIFQSHGISDPVLPYEMANKLKGILENGLSSYVFSSFNGGHEIPLAVIKDLKTFIHNER